jgi:hypothetical protein
MKTYHAKAVITLAAGSVIALNEKQAADRAPRMERLAAGRYRLKEALQMKSGESFGYEGDLPKAVAVLVEAAPDKSEEKKTGGKKAGK